MPLLAADAAREASQLLFLAALVRFVPTEDVGRVMLVLALIRTVYGLGLAGTDTMVSAFCRSDGRAALLRGARLRLRAVSLGALVVGLGGAALLPRDPVTGRLLLLAALALPAAALIGPSVAYLSGLCADRTALRCRLGAEALPALLAGGLCAASARPDVVVAGYVIAAGGAGLAAYICARALPDLAERPPRWAPPAFVGNARRLSVVHGAQALWHEVDLLAVAYLGGFAPLALYGAARMLAEPIYLLTGPLRELATPADGAPAHGSRAALWRAAGVLAAFTACGLLALPVALEVLAPGYAAAWLPASLLLIAAAGHALERVLAPCVYRQGRQQWVFVLVIFVLPFAGLAAIAWGWSVAGVKGVAAVRLAAAGCVAACAGLGAWITLSRETAKRRRAPDCDSGPAPAAPAPPPTRSEGLPRP